MPLNVSGRDMLLNAPRWLASWMKAKLRDEGEINRLKRIIDADVHMISAQRQENLELRTWLAEFNRVALDSIQAHGGAIAGCHCETCSRLQDWSNGAGEFLDK